MRVIDVPDNLKTGAFDVLSAEAGAYVITNSWGSAGINYYNSYCKQADSYMYGNSKGSFFSPMGTVEIVAPVQ